MFLTAVNHLEIREHWQTEFDLTKPRIAIYRKTWKVHKNTVYWVNFGSRSEEGIDVPPDPVKRDHPLQHSFFVLDRKSGTREKGRGTVRSGAQITSFTAQNHTKTRLDKKTN